jgi:CO/xanthine dehydrogenase FAD-binding subunit
MNATQPRAVRGMAATKSYIRPTSVAQAMQILARDQDAPHRRVVIAGGTDIYPVRVGRTFAEPVLDLSALTELRGIREEPGYFEIGALTTWSDVLRGGFPPLFKGLQLAAKEVGGVQIQNAGTVGGNLCNASPAADGVPPLLALGAEVVLASASGSRTLPLDRFILGNRNTALLPGELMLSIRVPKPQGQARSGFYKLGSRKYLVISIVMAAATLDLDSTGRVTQARVAVGACSPAARRLPGLEASLTGVAADGALGDVVRAEHLTPLAPIDDVRGSAAYRNDATVTVLRRLLNELGGSL